MFHYLASLHADKHQQNEAESMQQHNFCSNLLHAYLPLSDSLYFSGERKETVDTLNIRYYLPER